VKNYWIDKYDKDQLPKMGTQLVGNLLVKRKYRWSAVILNSHNEVLVEQQMVRLSSRPVFCIGAPRKEPTSFVITYYDTNPNLIWDFSRQVFPITYNEVYHNTKFAKPTELKHIKVILRLHHGDGSELEKWEVNYARCSQIDFESGYSFDNECDIHVKINHCPHEIKREFYYQ
jgi:hypothetical protein